MLTLGIKSLFLGLSLLITVWVYPMIKRLYDLFMYLATFQFLDNEFINNVWNNLYVLVGVIVLFAIAIKLISAMVNPDTLTDNKKGVKGAYLRTVIAVVLIFACPILFKLSYEIQRDLLKNDFLVRTVFGYKVDSTKSIGQMLAWETFSAFCAPVDSETKALVKVESWEDSPILDFYYSLEDNIDPIAGLYEIIYVDETITTAVGEAAGFVVGGGMGNPLGGAEIGALAGGTIELGFEYHDILCPLAGLLVAYELILLCMDTMFRSAKIAILELMLPIVLGAYVFNPEILKKWAKEFFSTYLSVFLKVLALGFMILALEALREVFF